MSSFTSQAKALRILLLGTFLWLFTSANAQERQEGYASFYHDKFNGRRTACGEKFNNNSYTCAHPTLPFGTKVEVVNLENGRYAVLTVNDRGPFAKKRIIDVTKKVARELDFYNRGTVKVSVRVMDDNPQMNFNVDEIEARTNLFGIEIGSFNNHEDIAAATKMMNDNFGISTMVRKQQVDNDIIYKLYVGNIANREEADNILSAVDEAFPNANLEAYYSDFE